VVICWAEAETSLGRMLVAATDKGLCRLSFNEDGDEIRRRFPRTYTQLAMVAGNPRAVRAAGTACGQNQVAVLIPCHRAKRSDCGLGGYAYGLAIKEALLERERGVAALHAAGKAGAVFAANATGCEPG
jgi:O-6-methylguanine DNA methyltransferase